MRSVFCFVSLLLFTVFAASGFYANYCYMKYRDLISKSAVVGLISGIRASFRWMHDPSDPNVSDECLAYFKRAKIAALVAGATWIVTIVFMLVIRAAGLFETSRAEINRSAERNDEASCADVGAYSTAGRWIALR